MFLSCDKLKLAQWKGVVVLLAVFCAQNEWKLCYSSTKEEWYIKNKNLFLMIGC